MAQIDRKFERQLKRINPINDQIKKITVPTTKLRTPPSFCVYSYGATCLTATRITF